MNPRLILLSACVLGACSSPPKQAARNHRVEVPLPATTPFDASPEDRAAYLDGYREGYASARSGNFIHRTYDRNFYDLPPRLQGWQVGHYEGQSAYISADNSNVIKSLKPD